MYESLISKDNFLYKLNHTTEDYIKEIAKETAKVTKLNINLDQSKPDLINTLFAIFYKSKESLPEKGLLESDGLNTFSFEAHFQSPFSDNSFLKPYYMRLVDYFGVDKKFLRSDAKIILKDLVKIRQDGHSADVIVHRIFQRIQKDFQKFADSYERGKYMKLNRVVKWVDSKPLFKKDIQDR